MNQQNRAIKKAKQNKVMARMTAIFSRRRLGDQLTLLVGLGVSIMVLSVSIGTSILINKSLTNSFYQNGMHIAAVLAEQSALPVLLGSPEGARQALEVVLAFPSVTQVAIYEANNSLLAQSGEIFAWKTQILDRKGSNELAFLEHDSRKYWQFLSPVYSDSAEPELEDLEANRKQEKEIGVVRVLISKDELYSARNNIILGNIFVSLLLASVLALALNGLSGALTKPLGVFVDTMIAGARGEETNLRVDLSGSKEIRQLSNAFNSMMQVLDERELELATARDQALDSAKLKAEFAANVSHEIRTPLNGILGTLNLLRDADLNTDQQELISLAESSSEALMILINDILDFSRLSLDQSSLINTEFDLHQLLEELVFLHAQSADATKIDVLLCFEVDLPYLVESDPNKLRQLLNNLINNAVKFTDSGSVTIAARKETDAEGKLWIRLSVSDSGIGISEKDLRTIFMPYAQSDGSMSRKYSGTGLGLAISDKLAELLHGDIGVFSEPGVGSEFYVRIPFSYRAHYSSERFSIPSGFSESIVVYGSTEPIREACKNLCDLHHLQSTIFSELSSLEEHLSQADMFEGSPLLMFYLSANDDPLFLWDALEGLIERYSVEAIVISREKMEQRFVGQNVSFFRPPLRDSVLKATTLRGVNGDEGESGAKSARYSNTLFASSTVLLVEDNIVNQRVAKAMLEKLGCNVVVAENGIEALEQAERNDFNLIYMDCQLPRMNGYDATRAIRRLVGKNRHVPIIAMTANVGQQDRAHCFDAGMNDFLGKPLRLDDIAAVTVKWISVKGDDFS